MLNRLEPASIHIVTLVVLSTSIEAAPIGINDGSTKRRDNKLAKEQR